MGQISYFSLMFNKLFTKAKVESVLTGVISTHSHSGTPGAATWGGIGGILSDQTDLNSALGDKVDKVTGKGLSENDYTDAEQTKLTGVEANANNYSHPANHAASIITQDSSNRFVSDTEKATWDSKEAGNANIQSHISSAHAPSTAQANADITKAEIEAKLTGEISSHTHAGGSGGLNQEQTLRLI